MKGDMMNVVITAAKAIALIGIGVVIGAFEENMRYSIIHHEAKKGDEKCQKIVDQFDEVGTWIESKFNK